MACSKCSTRKVVSSCCCLRREVMCGGCAVFWHATALLCHGRPARLLFSFEQLYKVTHQGAGELWLANQRQCLTLSPIFGFMHFGFLTLDYFYILTTVAGLSYVLCLAIVKTTPWHGKFSIKHKRQIHDVHTISPPRLCGLAIVLAILILLSATQLKVHLGADTKPL